MNDLFKVHFFLHVFEIIFVHVETIKTIQVSKKCLLCCFNELPINQKCDFSCVDIDIILFDFMKKRIKRDEKVQNNFRNRVETEAEKDKKKC